MLGQLWDRKMEGHRSLDMYVAEPRISGVCLSLLLESARCTEGMEASTKSDPNYRVV
jgi:hypothetical protein